MALNDCKIKDEDFDSLDIESLSDRPSADGMSAQALKERFDAGTKRVVKPKYNQLIDLLTSQEGADNIGITPIEGVAGYTVQQILLAIKLLLDDKKNAEQSDREIAQKFDSSEAQALVKEVTFSEDSGVFTITKYDGSVQTYDTALEKVALDVRLDGQQFVLTLADGTEQRVDLSAFITQTEVKSSDTITLAIENGAIVARITSGSVMLSHLNAEVTAYIDAKEAAAASSAAAAKLSEQNALNSANTAKASEQAAKDAQQAAEQAAKEAQKVAGGDFAPADHTHTAADVGALPLDGSVPMSGTLVNKKVNNGSAEFYKNHSATFDGGTIIQDNEENGNKTQLILKGKNATENLLQLVRRTDVNKHYNIFGEHNTDLLASTIKSLIDSGVIEVGEKAYTPSSNLLKTVVGSQQTHSGGTPKYIAKWVPEKSGAVTLKTEIFNSNDGRTSIYIYTPVHSEYENSTNSPLSKLGGMYKLECIALGATFASSDVPRSLTITTSSATATTEGMILDVVKGVPVYFSMASSVGAADSAKCNSIKIYADEV